MNNEFQNLTLLYVEDDKIIRENAISYLSNYFKHILEAKNGQEAILIYKEKKPNIIITDIKMPKLNGLEMAEKIREFDKNIPIIITTAFTDTSFLLKAIDLQLIKYIIKPITSRKLTEALNLVLENLHLKNILSIKENSYYDRFNKVLVEDKLIIKLTHKETLLLDLLAKNHYRMVSYEEIENIIWYDDSMSKDALRALVRTLRKKLNGGDIENISGLGYRLNVL